MKDGLAAVFIENCEDEIKMQILRKKGQLTFFEKHNIISLLLGDMVEKLKKEVALLKSQKVACRCAAISLKIYSEQHQEERR